jgi:hypothetical protein
MMNLEEERRRLARKCNTQIGIIKGLLQEIGKYDNALCEGAALMFLVCKELVRQDAFYRPIKETETSRRYRIVENKAFKMCVSQMVGKEGDAKKYMEFWADIGFLGRDSSGRIASNHSVDGRSQRSVRVAKGLIEIFEPAELTEQGVQDG